MRLVEEPDLERFLRVAWDLYACDRDWIPPLKSDQRELLATGRRWLVEREGRDVGRVAAFRHRFWGTFGFFECVNDREASGRLLAAAEDWLGGQGAEQILGPLSPTLHEVVGVLVDGEPGPATLMMAYNPRYYGELIEAAGYSRGRDFLAYWMEPGGPVAPLPIGYTLRGLDRSRLKAEVRCLTELHNCCYSAAGHYAFEPITGPESERLAANLAALIDPRLVLFVEQDGVVVAALAALPDVNPALRHLDGEPTLSGALRYWWARQRLEAIRIVDVLVAPEHQGRGLGARLVERALSEAARRGCQLVEYSWVVEDNEPSHRLARRFGGRLVRRYRVFEKALSAGRL